MASSVKTLLFDFRLKTIPTTEAVQQQIVDVIESQCLSTCSKALKLAPLQKINRNNDIQTFIFESNMGEAFLVVRVYKDQAESYFLLTVCMELAGNLYEELVEKFDPQPEEALRIHLKSSIADVETAHLISPIMRCLKDSPYLRTSDNRILQYNFKEVLFSQQSPFQYVQIVDTIDFGRLLILDEMANLAESDTILYTHSLMNFPHENYKGKEVLILGGGDGGLIKELFELGDEAPAFVTMVDIDEMVMDACSKHMRSVCGNFLDRENWEGPKHKIIAGDAIKYIQDCQSSGKKFDYIFGDLTDTPVSTGPRDSDVWQFLKTILEMAIKLLKPNTGKYLTHCTGLNVEDSLLVYEKVLSELAGGTCSFTRTSNFVNSFMETWVFYQITRKD